MAVLVAVICCAVLAVAAARVARFSYIGCFKDNYRIVRDLNGLHGVSRLGELVYSDLVGLPDNRMTHEFCSKACSLGGFPYFSLQYNYECFCGKSYGLYGAASESDCTAACKGNATQMCGGIDRNSVFAQFYQNNAIFFKTEFPRLTVEATWSTFSTMTVASRVKCVALCQISADCQAVIFSKRQRLCYRLRFAYPPASLSGVTGDYYLCG